MNHATEALYAERLGRYVTAMRNGQPDRVPIRPFAAEISAKYAGFTCQDVTYDYRRAFEAVLRCYRDFDWDAAVPNMVYVWTGLTQAAGLRYYGVPGIDVGPDVTFQYREPADGNHGQMLCAASVAHSHTGLPHPQSRWYLWECLDASQDARTRERHRTSNGRF